ncbi:MAG: division/cell wall cluster transcriptional repressor MraZ [Oscillospiraceae bacterium]
MTGKYQHTIDSKGRLFIPAKLRDELGKVFYVTIGMDACLSMYSMESWNSFTEKFDQLPYSQSRRMRPLFANAAKCEMDAQGRILIPAELRRYANLKKDVLIIGVSSRAEIWNPEAYSQFEQPLMEPSALGEAMSELGF